MHIPPLDVERVRNYLHPKIAAAEDLATRQKNAVFIPSSNWVTYDGNDGSVARGEAKEAMGHKTSADFEGRRRSEKKRLKRLRESAAADDPAVEADRDEEQPRARRRRVVLALDARDQANQRAIEAEARARKKRLADQMERKKRQPKILCKVCFTPMGLTYKICDWFDKGCRWVGCGISVACKSAEVEHDESCAYRPKPPATRGATKMPSKLTRNDFEVQRVQKQSEKDRQAIPRSLRGQADNGFQFDSASQEQLGVAKGNIKLQRGAKVKHYDYNELASFLELSHDGKQAKVKFLESGVTATWPLSHVYLVKPKQKPVT